MPITEREKELRAIVDAIRDNPDGTALARLIVNGIENARFEGLGGIWDQARYVADLALKAGWQPPVVETAPGEVRPFAVEDSVLITLPADDPCEHYSGQVGKITHAADDEGGYIVKVGTGTLRALPDELTLVAAPAEPAEAGVAAHA
jgi:hypothetical protein